MCRVWLSEWWCWCWLLLCITPTLWYVLFPEGFFLVKTKLKPSKCHILLSSTHLDCECRGTDAHFVCVCNSYWELKDLSVHLKGAVMNYKPWSCFKGSWATLGSFTEENIMKVFVFFSLFSAALFIPKVNKIIQIHFLVHHLHFRAVVYLLITSDIKRKSVFFHSSETFICYFQSHTLRKTTLQFSFRLLFHLQLSVSELCFQFRNVKLFHSGHMNRFGNEPCFKEPLH